jgi:DNA mismatch repair protein MutS
MTPAMQQFHDIKADYPDHIVLFRMGDFYETFYDDAKRAAAILGITLTARDKERKTPMAGIPYHALDTYLGKLIDHNEKVVIVEQLEDPKEAKGVVKRGIVKIVTPGTNTLEKDSKQQNYLTCVHLQDKTYYISYIDLIEGTIYYTLFTNKKDFENNLILINPKEILIQKDSNIDDYFTRETYFKLKPFLNFIQFEDDLSTLSDYINPDLLKDAQKLEIVCIYQLLIYLLSTQKTTINHISKISKVSSKSIMNLDPNVVRNLELIEGSRKGALSLFDLLDLCKTAAGSKKLKNWIINPLLEQKKIDDRLQSVQTLVEHGGDILNSLHDFLTQIHDLQRISSKVGLSSANARDLRNTVESIKIIFNLNKELKNYSLSTRINDISLTIDQEIKKSQTVLAHIDKTIHDTPPLSVREGGMIKSGIDKDLDALHDLKTGGKDWLKNFEQEEIKRSGIPTLKVRFNKVFGYYIEVSKLQSERVPEHFIRKQTLVNAERYITPELKEQEANILGADDRICKIEYEIFSKTLESVKEIIPNLQKIIDVIAELDIYIAFALVALKYTWTRPNISQSDLIKIEDGRHPIIEHFLQKEGKNFVKNSICINEEKSLQIITGPNMGGKSTFIRQTAIITLLAQIGSFVPAQNAEIGIVDRIFTRVGASDNLSQGESTFMVEMLEASEILRNATPRSLIILDEIGRGTSTFDGMSIAWAIGEYLQNLGAKTLFATHYHELTELSNKYSNVKNLAVKVVDYNNEIIFMHQIIDGKADKSYGIHVAKLAGLPDKVIKTSEKVLKLLEKEKNKLQPTPVDLFGEESNQETPDFSDTHQLQAIDIIKKVDIDTLTPIGALQFIADLKSILN